MPGPLSTPKGWGTTKKNKGGDHGNQANGPRKSGKTAYDRESGKWVQHIVNVNVGREYGARFKGSEKR